MKNWLLLVVPVALSACQTSDYQDLSSTRDLDGVWRGAVSEQAGLESVQALVLDGLMLAISEDGQRAHSGQFVLDNGDLAGVLAMRDENGERDRDYAVIGSASPYDLMQADLVSDSARGQLSLNYDLARSDDGASYEEVAGLYALDAPGLQLTLSIDDFGAVEGYDDAGCAYFGQVLVPDWQINVYQFSLEIEGCALEGEYGFGLASLKYDRNGWPQLVLPVWFDDQDRVEPWVLERV